jgi:hypothetical protein
MERWICPHCDREFQRENQAHTCVPGCTVDQCFDRRPPVQRAIYDAIVAHLATLGPLHLDAVSVGVFLKSDRKIAEVRPRSKSVSLALIMPRTLRHARVVRTVRSSFDRRVHFFSLVAVDDVDDDLRDWLTEAYDMATG